MTRSPATLVVGFRAVSVRVSTGIDTTRSRGDGGEFAGNAAEQIQDASDGLLEYSPVETRGDPFEPVDLNVPGEDVREVRLRTGRGLDGHVHATDNGVNCSNCRCTISSNFI